MSARGGKSAIVTSCHVLPSSVVSLIRPRFVPTQITPGFTVDNAMDWIAEPTGVPGAPRPRIESGGTTAPAGNPRPGDRLVQCAPPSVVAITNWKPANSSCWFQGANAKGCEMVVRP